MYLHALVYCSIRQPQTPILKLFRPQSQIDATIIARPTIPLQILRHTQYVRRLTVVVKKGRLPGACAATPQPK